MNKILLENKNTLVICPDHIRNRLLEQFGSNGVISDVSYISYNDYLSRYSFDYGTDAILYLTNKYSMSVSNAKEQLNALRYIDPGAVYNNEKLDCLVSLYRELKDAGLLVFDPCFSDYLSDKHVIYMGYGIPDSHIRSVISLPGADFVFDEMRPSYVPEITRFSDSENEVLNLFERVADLLEKGVFIDKIHVIYDESYASLIHRYNSYYPFEIEESFNVSVYGTEVGRKFISFVRNNDRAGAYEYLCSVNNEVSDSLIALLNRYASYELITVLPLIEHDLVRIPYKSPSLTGVVHKGHLYDLLDEDEYLFVLGFSDRFAHFLRNDAFLDDTMRSLLNMPRIEEENSLIRSSVCGYLSNVRNIYLSYSKKSAFDKYNEQNLFDNCVYLDSPANTISYSKSSSRLHYSYLLDQYRKYGTESEELGIYKHNYGDNGYGSFDNSFDGDIGKTEVSLSYTGLDTFYKCPFSWYLRYVLGIKEESDERNATLGTIAHDLLKDGIGIADLEELSSLFDKLSSNHPSQTHLEAHFRELLKEELITNISLIREQMSSTALNKRDYEAEYTIGFREYSSLVFNGKIDKLVYAEKDGVITFYVVDYKTGKKDEIEEKLMKYGFSLQLPCYLYLLSKSERFSGKELRFGGIYLQHIITYDVKYDEEKDLNDKKKESLKLTGYSTSDKERLALIDIGLNDSGVKSEIIKGMSITAKGDINARSKVLSDEEVTDMINNVDRLIRLAYSAVSRGDYEIAPKVISEHNRSCKYCRFEDICFRRQKDVKYIDPEED